MQVTDILDQMGGIQSMARELGVSESQATAAAIRSTTSWGWPAS